MKKILLIDDHKETLELVQLILETEGYEVFTSVTGDSMMDILAVMPDLILLDNWLPEIDGSALCKVLKQIPETRHIKVLLLSATQPLGKIARECNADGYIEKPFDVNKLIDLIKYHINEIAEQCI